MDVARSARRRSQFTLRRGHFGLRPCSGIHGRPGIGQQPVSVEFERPYWQKRLDLSLAGLHVVDQVGHSRQSDWQHSLYRQLRYKRPILLSRLTAVTECASGARLCRRPVAEGCLMQTSGQNPRSCGSRWTFLRLVFDTAAIQWALKWIATDVPV